MTKFVSAIAIALVFTIAGINQATASSIVAGVTDDRGFENSGNPLSQNDVYLRVFGADVVWRAGIEFSLSGISPGSTINSATLFLSNRGTSANGTILVNGYSGDGVVTFADMSANNQIASFNTINNVSANYNLDVTSFIQSLVNSNASFSGFMLRSSVEGSSVFAGADIASSEYGSIGNSSYVPTLTIDFTAASVPEPSSLALAGLGGIGLIVGAVRRRRGAAV